MSRFSFKRSCSTIALAIGLVSVCGISQADPQVDPNAQYITQAYAYMDSGWLTVDTAKMTAYMTSNFQYTKPGGKTIDRADYVKGLYFLATVGGKGSGKAAAKTTITRMLGNGNEIVAYRIFGFSSADGPTQGMRGLFYYADTWLRTTKGWVMTKETMTGYKRL